MSLKRPPPSEGSLVEFDDSPTEIGQSWFPSGPSLPRALPSSTSVSNVQVAGGSRSHLQEREDVGSFPAASSTLPPSLERAPETHRVRLSTFAAARGLVLGLALTGLVGLGAIAYKQMSARTAASAASGSSAGALMLDGDVEPARQASLQVRGGAHVSTLAVTVGKTVHEGDVIATFDSPGSAAGPGISSTLKAPFDGVVTAIYTNAGAQLPMGAGVPVAELADTSRVRVRLALAPAQESQVRAGDPVTVWSETDPSRTVRASIARVIPSLNARPASAELELDHAGLTPLDKVHAQLR